MMHLRNNGHLNIYLRCNRLHLRLQQLVNVIGSEIGQLWNVVTNIVTRWFQLFAVTNQIDSQKTIEDTITGRRRHPPTIPCVNGPVVINQISAKVNTSHFQGGDSHRSPLVRNRATAIRTKWCIQPSAATASPGVDEWARMMAMTPYLGFKRRIEL